MLFTKDIGEIYASFSYYFSNKERKISYSSVYSNNYEVNTTNKEIIMYYTITNIRMLEDKCLIPNIDEIGEKNYIGINKGVGVIQINDLDKFEIEKIDINLYTWNGIIRAKVTYHYLQPVI
jgi:hypothetical protein